MVTVARGGEKWGATVAAASGRSADDDRSWSARSQGRGRYIDQETTAAAAVAASFKRHRIRPIGRRNARLEFLKTFPSPRQPVIPWGTFVAFASVCIDCRTSKTRNGKNEKIKNKMITRLFGIYFLRYFKIYPVIKNCTESYYNLICK